MSDGGAGDGAAGRRGIERLLWIMARLRDPQNGCPWDLEQDFDTIAPYTIEEAYEVADAIAHRAWAELADELGDLLLQVVYHARMAEERGLFGFADVVEAISDKMLRRHPHVFGEETVAGAREQTVAWEQHKAAEREAAARAEDRHASALVGVPHGLPALTRALKLQRRAARVGFDWPETAPVLTKIDEELGEIRQEVRKGAPRERLADEIGDLFFACVNLARHLDIDPESALRRANTKFECRFRKMEQALRDEGKSPADATLDEMERLWQAAKRGEE